MDEDTWTTDAGDVAWYFYDLASEEILEEATEIVELIRCQPDTERRCEMEQPALSDICRNIEKHIKNSYLKKVQAPIGIKPVLKAWMELN